MGRNIISRLVFFSLCSLKLYHSDVEHRPSRKWPTCDQAANWVQLVSWNLKKYGRDVVHRFFGQTVAPGTEVSEQQMQTQLLRATSSITNSPTERHIGQSKKKEAGRSRHSEADAWYPELHPDSAAVSMLSDPHKVWLDQIEQWHNGLNATIVHELLTYRNRVSLKEAQQFSFAGAPILVDMEGS
ncbi:MAG: hypothetical protein FRX49_04531 [Trebouxia sp. A1-2]|nr:MAG: hypothetical protein FRX49_04531 [Trebouxia sp. A1-2]